LAGWCLGRYPAALARAGLPRVLQPEEGRSAGAVTEPRSRWDRAEPGRTRPLHLRAARRNR